MSAAPPYKIKQHLIMAIVILGGFVLLFHVKYQPITQFKNIFSNTTTTTTNSNNTTTNNSNTTTTNKNITVLIWMWPFGEKFNLTWCRPVYNIEGCFLTVDRSFYNKSDGVIIHHRDINMDLSNLPKLQRPSFQKWIWMNFESPSNSPRLPRLDNLFNLTLNYRRDADIKVPYESIVAVESKEGFVPPSKNNLVCWIVSNWAENYERVKYYKELRKYVEVQVHGSAFGEWISSQHYNTIMISCKFYLSFENSIHKDYITEKFFNPLSLGTVPVVLGPPRQDYERLIQGDAFIHVNDFKSPKELAEYLLLLDKDDKTYLKYFEWRRHFQIVPNMHFFLKPACLSCDYLRLRKEKKTFKLNKWYWEQ